MKKNYRKDIDGLRALAVLGVIFYHAELVFKDNIIVSGGFLGVDIFFVISGYLITKIIYNEVKLNNSFSFFNFYQRRIRRIIPALLLVILFSSIMAYFFLLPIEFQAYLKSIVSSVFFYSNFHFHYSGQAYGENILSAKPLLHTWSLAIEEQFYIIYPILLIGCIKFFKKNIKTVLATLILLSILFATFISNDHQSFNFYMLTSRAWELLFGGLIAIKHLNSSSNKEDNSLFAVLGFIAIFFSFFFFDDVNEHPTLLTLLPVIGCCLIINNTTNNNIIGHILSSKVLSNMGLISYSLYLWHHPILSFGKISGITNDNISMKFFLILVSIILSILTYVYVERIFRDKKKIKIKNLISIITVSIILIISISYISSKSQSERYPKIVRNLHEKTWFKTKQFFIPCFQRDKFFCSFNRGVDKQKAFLVGDSVLASMQEELKKNLIKKNINFIPMTNAGCDFINIKLKEIKNINCTSDVFNYRNKKIIESKNSLIIIHLNYLNSDQYNNLETRNKFTKNINFLLTQNNKIIFLYPIPQWQINVSKYFDNKFQKEKNNIQSKLKLEKDFVTIKYDDFKKDSSVVFNILDNINNENIYRLYPHKIFCNTLIKGKCVANSTDDIYFIDNSHLSKAGSEIINIDLIKLIDNIQKK